jgi:hypothetical protein
MLTSSELQRQTLRLYGELLAHGVGTLSSFVLSCGSGSSATGLAAAVSIAGGTSLTLDPDSATVKSVLRAGGLDFLVTNLDEGLRVLKNEIRKHTPLSVAVMAEPGPMLAEMRERGVRPQLQVSFGPAEAMLLDGVVSLVLQDGPSPALVQWLAARGWTEHLLSAASTPELRALDVRLVQTFADSTRLQWIRRIPHYQRPDAAAGRAVWLTADEAAALVQNPLSSESR